MDIRQLKYFVAVAEKLNFTEAAKSLYVAQSAVSQQISELEKKLGVPLFNRNRRTVELTPGGKELYNHAIGILKRLDEIKEITISAHLGYKGHLRIGYIGYGDRTWLPSILNQFRLTYPDITLEVNRYNQGELIKALREDDLDLAVTFSFGITEQSKVETHHVHTETLCAVFAADSQQAKKWKGKSIPLKELSDELFIVQNRHESPQGFDKTLQLCSESGFSPKIVNTPNLVQTVLILVESHMGIALLPSSIKDYAGPNLTFLPLEKNTKSVQHDIVAAWKKDNKNPSLKYLTEMIGH